MNQRPFCSRNQRLSNVTPRSLTSTVYGVEDETAKTARNVQQRAAINGGDLFFENMYDDFAQFQRSHLEGLGHRSIRFAGGSHTSNNNQFHALPSGSKDATKSARGRYKSKKRGTQSLILISFDIDGTLEVGDPPGILTMDMVRKAHEKGILIGSCSDRPMSGQRAVWAKHGIEVDFVIPKHMLAEVKAKFEADVYYHIGDREDLDKRYALEAGFEFLWPHEAITKPWFFSDDDQVGESDTGS